MNIREYRGYKPEIAENAFIDPSAVIIGDVKVGEDSSVWPMVVARGDVHSIRIGNRTNIQDGTVMHVTHCSDHVPDGFSLEIGDDVTVGHKAMLHACKIGNLCLIGMGAVVLDGAVVEDKTVVGAGSIVPPGKVLKGGYLYLGNPVKQIRALSDDELAYFSYASKHYVELKNNCLAENWSD
ncbi:MAG: gamma carbonic anhydrase family protein [Gammaproteobacteria bacterium]|nr:MAG: gamma carbonic anhydrase family protein [Gammaproteobacteria bacterium]